MALIDLANGTLVDAPVLNHNFVYLDNRVTTTKTEITGGSSTTIASIASTMATIENNIGNGGVVPVGTVIMFAGTNTPTGYILCDGTVYDVTVEGNEKYQSLLGVLGSKYGGNGTSTFGVPNFIGRYPKASETAGTVGEAVVGQHTHSYQDNVASEHRTYSYGYNHTPLTPTSSVLDGINGADYTRSTTGVTGYSPSATFENTPTEPRNLTMLFCIKY